MKGILDFSFPLNLRPKIKVGTARFQAVCAAAPAPNTAQEAHPAGRTVRGDRLG
jgi:hypothetical protein